MGVFSVGCSGVRLTAQAQLMIANRRCCGRQSGFQPRLCGYDPVGGGLFAGGCGGLGLAAFVRSSVPDAAFFADFLAASDPRLRAGRVLDDQRALLVLAGRRLPSLADRPPQHLADPGVPRGDPPLR